MLGFMAHPTPITPATLATARLLLSPFELSDAPAVARLAGERAIADGTLTVPHPYSLEHAQEWIGTHAGLWATGSAAIFALRERPQHHLVGAIGLSLTPEHRRAELGYWVGVPWWGRGYCTEAAVAVVRFGFGQLGLERIFGMCFTRNPASGRVMEKLGMRREGVLRSHFIKWDRPVDAVVYGLLREQWTSGGDGSGR